MVSALAAVWTALAAIPGMTRPTSRVVALGLSLASACLYMAAAFGSDAGKVIASAASIPRQVAEIAFLLSIIPLVGIGSFLHALDSLSSRRATAEPVRARPCATTRERVLVEIPLVAAFWYIAHAHTNFFARMLLCVGSSMACSMFATEGAITATLLRERWWWIYCVLASWINVLTLRITGLPIAAAFFGGAFPLRIIYFAAFLVLIGYPALLLGTQRAAALAEYARTWGSADDKRKRNGTNSEQTKPVE